LLLRCKPDGKWLRFERFVVAIPSSSFVERPDARSLQVTEALREKALSGAARRRETPFSF
jgi:hypothetical protein